MSALQNNIFMKRACNLLTPKMMDANQLSSLRGSESFQFDNQEMKGSFKLKKSLAPAVIARYEAISRIAHLIYHRGVSLVKTTDESCVLDGEL